MRAHGWVVVLVVTGCDSPSAPTPTPSPATAPPTPADFAVAIGHIESTGPTGTWSFDRAPCYGGDDRGFYGVLIQPGHGNGISVKLVKDPVDNSWALAVNEADRCKDGSTTPCMATLFKRDMCKTFDIDVAMEITQARRRKIFNGSFSVDCSADDHSHVAGKLDLKLCQN